MLKIAIEFPEREKIMAERIMAELSPPSEGGSPGQPQAVEPEEGPVQGESLTERTRKFLAAGGEIKGGQDLPGGFTQEQAQRLVELARPRGAEGPPQPPDRNSLEFEASPERGREIAEEIVKWEALRADGKYNEVNWPRLNQLYLEQEVHIEALKKVSLDVKLYWERPEQPVPQIPLEIQKVNHGRFKDADGNNFRSLGEWITEYQAGAITDMDRFIREVNIYFDEAKRIGLLKDLDAVLAFVYERQVKQGIRRNLTTVDIMPAVNQRVEQALDSLRDTLNDRRWEDQEILRLANIGALYGLLARERFVTAINNRDLEELSQRPYRIDNEFRLGQDSDGDQPQEKYWHLEHGYYVYVDAQTPDEYMIAADSYISRLELITTSPQELLQEAKYFVQAVMRSEGFEKVNREYPGFLTELVYQIEGRIGVFGADNSNELYQLENYKAYMDYINKDGKGPQRWLALAKLLDGQVAATLWALDKDPRWEILFSLFGSRGQLAKASEVQRNSMGTQGLFAQVRDLFIEEMMGVALKDKRDIANLSAWMPDRKFVSMFEGLYRYGKVPQGQSYGDANIRAYERFKDVDDRNLIPDQRRAKRLGRIQLDLRSGKRVEELDASDRNFYKQARDTAEKAFDIAFQIYGALGEKSKRAGGVFKVNRVKDREEFQDFIPVHYAEKFIQFAETWTKIKYANVSAKERTAKVKAARERAITELKKNGFEAKLYDESSNPMMLKRPKEDANGNVMRDVRGNVIVEEVLVDFYIATHHPYGDWTGHTYWSYQEEDRHLILDPVSFAEARKIRAGQLRPEDATPWAVQLLILDPTLSRVRRFNKKNFEERERKLTMVAVEDSYQSHWRIGRELYRAFFPKYGTPTEDIGIYYGLQDYGGYRKMIEHSRARAAEDPERFSRRGRRLIPDIHIPAVALSEYLGVGSVGALGVIRMLGAPIYRMCGTFALDKFATQSEIAGMLYDALFISKKDNEGNVVEPLLLKLTNEADVNLQPFALTGLIKPEDTWSSPADQQALLAAIRKSFGRLERYEKLLSTMESLIRNATGALWLEEVEVLTDSGRLSSEVERRFRALPDINKEDVTREDLARFIKEAEEVEKMTEDEFDRNFNSGDYNRPGIDEGATSVDTGSGKRSARIWHYAFFDMFMDEGKRGGFDIYPGEKYIFQHLNDKIVVYNPNMGRSVEVTDETTIEWLLSKFVPT